MQVFIERFSPENLVTKNIMIIKKALSKKVFRAIKNPVKGKIV